MKIPVYISGEDEVTVEVTKRVLGYCSQDFSVIKNIPARGGEVKNKISALNKLSNSAPVVVLVDLDADSCAPILKERLLQGVEQNDNFILNIAVDEAEAWLAADRDGMAKFLKVNIDDIPKSHLTKQGGKNAVVEMEFKMKCSLELTHVIALKSKDKTIRETIGSKDKRCKGKEYNPTIVPFIRNDWNIENALRNSDSLRRMIERLKLLVERIDNSGIHGSEEPI